MEKLSEKDAEVFQVLLVHWINHNGEHVAVSYTHLDVYKRQLLDSAMMAMAMCCGLSSAIINPCDKRLMETVVACDIIKNNILYADSVLEF